MTILELNNLTQLFAPTLMVTSVIVFLSSVIMAIFQVKAELSVSVD